MFSRLFLQLEKTTLWVLSEWKGENVIRETATFAIAINSRRLTAITHHKSLLLKRFIIHLSVIFSLFSTTTEDEFQCFIWIHTKKKSVKIIRNVWLFPLPLHVYYIQEKSNIKTHEKRQLMSFHSCKGIFSSLWMRKKRWNSNFHSLSLLCLSFPHSEEGKLFPLSICGCAHRKSSPNLTFEKKKKLLLTHPQQRAGEEYFFLPFFSKLKRNSGSRGKVFPSWSA